MDKLLRRSLISVTLVAIVAVVIFVFPAYLFAIVIAAFIGFAQIEFFQMVENKKIFVYKYFGTIVGILVPIVIYIESAFHDVVLLEPLLIVSASLFAVVLQFIRKDQARDHLVSISVTLFSLFYISWFFSFLVKMRLLDNGSNYVAFVVLITKGADIGAYLGGSRFGRKELLPRISPKKTVEGTFFGLLASLVMAVAIGPMLTDLPMMHLVLISIMLGVIGQVGDLAESLIKRDCSVKDSGRHLLDIGGFFDLIDSLLFTVPIFYYYITAF